LTINGWPSARIAEAFGVREIVPLDWMNRKLFVAAGIRQDFPHEGRLEKSGKRRMLRAPTA